MRPFVVVTPIGLREREGLAAAMRRFGVRMRSTIAVAPWSEASSRLHRQGLTAAGVARAARIEMCWRQACPSDRAECWALVDADDYRRLRSAQATLQQRFGGEAVPAAAAGETVVLPAFHVPDPAAMPREAERLRDFLGTGRVTGRQPIRTG